MKMSSSILRKLARLAAFAVASGFVVACSTTRSLADGELRLARNRVVVLNDEKYNTKDIESYIKQKSNSYLIFGWNPFLNVYNWSGQNGEKGLGKIARKIGVAPVIFESSLVGSSCENIERHLEYLGYYGSKVESFTQSEGKNIDVTYNVTLGKRFTIGKIDFEVPSGQFNEDFMADTANLSIKAGDYLSESALEKESERSAAYFRKNGYFGFTKNYYFFEADTLFSRDTANLKMMVREYTRNQVPESARPLVKYDFGSVSILQDNSIRFNENVLKNICTIRPGMQYDERDVNNTYSRFSALKVFNGVNVALTPRDTNLVDCVVSLSKSKLQGFKVDMEGSTNSTGLIGVSPKVSYYHKNIFHGGQWLNISFLGNFQFKMDDSGVKSNEFGVSSSLSFPEFLGLPNSMFRGPNVPRSEIGLSYNYQNRPEYTRNMISLEMGYSGSLNNGHFLYQFHPLQSKLVKLTDMDEDFLENLMDNPFILEAYQNHLDAGAGAMAYYTSAGEMNPNRSYEYLRVQLDASGNVLSLFNPLMRTEAGGRKTIWDTPYSQYVRTELTLGKTIVFGESSRHALAMRTVGGVGFSYGNSSSLPFEKQFYCGGASSMRGWQARSLGPGASKMDPFFIIPSQTGDMKFEANLEYRFPMFWKFCGALFTDVGNVWTIRDEGSSDNTFRLDSFGRTIAANWGLGLRMDLSFLILRLDLGVKIYDPSLDADRWYAPSRWIGNDACALHFGVGYPF